MTKRKSAYLTIDDGPSPDSREKVDYLVQLQIPTLLFFIGQNMEERMDEAVYAAKHGFVIGNHSYSHPHFSDISLEECYKQIDRTHEIIDQVYKNAGVVRHGNYFRFPYGDKADFRLWKWKKGLTPEGRKRHSALQDHLRSRGYTKPKFLPSYSWYQAWGLDTDIDWAWTYDCKEYRLAYKWWWKRMGINTIEDVFARMDEATPKHEHCLSYGDGTEMVLLHDHVHSTKYFKEIIDHLRAKVDFIPLPL